MDLSCFGPIPVRSCCFGPISGSSFWPSWGGSFQPYFTGESFRPDFLGELFRPDLFILGKQVI